MADLTLKSGTQFDAGGAEIFPKRVRLDLWANQESGRGQGTLHVFDI